MEGTFSEKHLNCILQAMLREKLMLDKKVFQLNSFTQVKTQKDWLENLVWNH